MQSDTLLPVTAPDFSALLALPGAYNQGIEQHGLGQEELGRRIVERHGVYH